MTNFAFTRRQMLTGLMASSLVSALPAMAQTAPKMHVLKDPGCGCCGAWIDIMQQAGFDVSVQELPNAELFAHKQAVGITESLASCHTATVGGYLIEGHVPPADILRLLDLRPDALGLTVPGMPWGAPGMGPETERDAYDVLLMRREGGADIFTRYAAA